MSLLKELKILEENVEQSLLREEAALGSNNSTTMASGDEQMSRLEVCQHNIYSARRTDACHRMNWNNYASA
jgi:hypothetical protein